MPGKLSPPWKPGESGNPAGRPKGRRTLKIVLQQLMGQTIKYKDLDGREMKMKVEDAIGVALVAKALLTGDTKAIEMIRNELDGTKPKDDTPDNLNEVQKQIVQRALIRALPTLEKMQDITPKQG